MSRGKDLFKGDYLHLKMIWVSILGLIRLYIRSFDHGSYLNERLAQKAAPASPQVLSTLLEAGWSLQ